MRWAWIAVFLLASPRFGHADDNRLGPDDLDAYEKALGVADEDDAPTPATFRDLWDRPDSLMGKRVRVEGRVVRLFHQGKSPRFPGLVEVWLVTPARDPICVVIPDAKGGPTLGQTLAFTGTYLKKVAYVAGDEPRLAPLIVGPGPGRAVEGQGASPDQPVRSGVWPLSNTDWTLAGFLAAGTLVFLLRQHLRSPLPLRRERPGPDPIFEDGEPGSGGGQDE